MMSVNMISQQSQIRVAAVATLLAVYVMFWSGLEDTQIISPILAAFSKLNNLNYKHFFGCFIGKLLVMIEFLMRVFFQPSRDSGLRLRSWMIDDRYEAAN